MIKRPTWILLGVLVLVVAGYFIFRTKGPTSQSTLTPTVTANSYLITQADGTLTSFRISNAQGDVTQLQRDASGTWMIALPTPGPADLSLAGAFESQVQALRIVSTLDSTLSLQDAGLISPAYTIRLTFTGNLQHIIEVGSLTLSNSGYYVRFDDKTLYVIAKDGIDSLTNMIKSPPYAPTETPAPELTTPTSMVTETPTPELLTPTTGAGAITTPSSTP